MLPILAHLEARLALIAGEAPPEGGGVDEGEPGVGHLGRLAARDRLALRVAAWKSRLYRGVSTGLLPGRANGKGVAAMKTDGSEIRRCCLEEQWYWDVYCGAVCCTWQ